MQPSKQDVRFTGSIWAHTEELHDPASCVTDMGRTSGGKSGPPLTAGRQGACTRLKRCMQSSLHEKEKSDSESGKEIRWLWDGNP